MTNKLYKCLKTKQIHKQSMTKYLLIDFDIL